MSTYLEDYLSNPNDTNKELGLIELAGLFNNAYAEAVRKRRYLGRYFAHPMMQNRRAKRDDYKPSAVRVTQRCVP
ncbi:hypothetical protein PsalN5692_02724 [Piscirickettsia salmonis]|uniref:hypothetical protein n=1 Tax=Piscirickettsia salmonis TaxID=1238 RepID=UPI0012B8B84A|nr:hypothetical protein [Piscirickettsia salmonis]QGP51243.1 hypothetical protein PsalN5692_02724 [Piscirickettsia salmonis]